MTREQAIIVLNMVEAHGLADEAKRMAIKALEQEREDDKMKKYIVEIGYRLFEFDNMKEAGTFADIAFYHLLEKDDRTSISIRIKEVTENDSESD